MQNACIYNPPEHEVNMEAHRLFKEASDVFQRRYRKMLRCRVCLSDSHENSNLLDICDFCCEGVHERCNPVGARPSVQGCHPFRGDDAW